MAKELVSYREFARRIFVNESAVRKAIVEERFTKGVNKLAKKIDPAKAANDAWVQQQQAIKAKAGVSREKAVEKIEKSEKKTSAQRTAPQVQKSTVPQQLAAKNKQLPADNDDEVTGDESELLNEIKIYKSMSLKEAMRLREVFGAALDKVKLQEAEGTLVKRSEVEKSLFAYGNQLKKALQTYPMRVIDNILAAPNKIEAINIMQEEINIVLNQFSNPSVNIKAN